MTLHWLLYAFIAAVHDSTALLTTKVLLKLDFVVKRSITSSVSMSGVASVVRFVVKINKAGTQNERH